MPSSFFICRSERGSACASSCWRAATARLREQVPTSVTTLSDAQIEALGDDYNTPIHLRAAPEVAGRAVNERADLAALTAQFEEQGAVAVDDLLTPPALDSLRRFLLESTIWHDFSHIDGFVASYLEDGLACPLLLQIADELRHAFPEILGPHPLSQAWAFKGLRAAGGGRRPRRRCRRQRQFLGDADGSQPRPGRGGLVVCRTPPPDDWEIKDYDADRERIVTFLEQKAGDSLVVPYRQNRAVLFRSRLFHHSDRPEFASGYENHRINLTLLYGQMSGRGCAGIRSSWIAVPKLTHRVACLYKAWQPASAASTDSRRSPPLARDGPALMRCLDRCRSSLNDNYTNAALRVGDADPYPQRLVGEFIGNVVSNDWVNEEYKHLVLKVHRACAEGLCGPDVPPAVPVARRRRGVDAPADERLPRRQGARPGRVPLQGEGRGTRGMAMLEPGDEFNHRRPARRRLHAASRAGRTSSCSAAASAWRRSRRCRSSPPSTASA